MGAAVPRPPMPGGGGIGLPDDETGGPGGGGIGLPDDDSGGLAPIGGTTGAARSTTLAAGSGTEGPSSTARASVSGAGASGTGAGRAGPDEPLDEMTRRGVAGASSASGAGSGTGTSSAAGSGVGSDSGAGVGSSGATAGSGVGSNSGAGATSAAGSDSSAAFLAFFGFFPGSSGWTSRTKPSRSALRRVRSACASTMLEEWLFTPMPSDSQRSRTSALVIPSSRANS